MNRLIVEQSLYNLFLAFFTLKGTPHTIRFGYDNANKPALPYCVLHVLSATPSGTPFTYEPPSDAGQSIFQPFELSVRVWLHGEEALSLLMQFSCVSMIPDIVDPMRFSSGLSILSMDSPRDISGYNDQFTEPRAVMDITFSFTIVFTTATGDKVPVGLLESAYMEGQIVVGEQVKTITIAKI